MTVGIFSLLSTAAGAAIAFAVQAWGRRADERARWRDWASATLTQVHLFLTDFNPAFAWGNFPAGDVGQAEERVREVQERWIAVREQLTRLVYGNPGADIQQQADELITKVRSAFTAYVILVRDWGRDQMRDNREQAAYEAHEKAIAALDKLNQRLHGRNKAEASAP